MWISDTMNKEVIYVLPRIPLDASFEEHHKIFMKNWELAKSIDYIPDSLETLKAIEYMDKKVMMAQNENFRNAALALCPDEIKMLIERDKKIATDMARNGEIEWEECEKVLKAETIENLIASGYYGDDYNSAFHEILNVLVEDYL